MNSLYRIAYCALLCMSLIVVALQQEMVVAQPQEELSGIEEYPFAIRQKLRPLYLKLNKIEEERILLLSKGASEEKIKELEAQAAELREQIELIERNFTERE